MSEDELDNFFAKKDKSKKKSKKLKSNKGVQQLHDFDSSDLPEEEVKKSKKKVKTEDDTIEKILGLNDNDWEKADDEDIDYASLKVNNRQLKTKKDNETTTASSHTHNDNSNSDDEDCQDMIDESSDSVKKESGPWRETRCSAPVKVYATEKPATEAPVKKVEPAGPKRYVPPSMRSSGGAGYRQTAKTRQMRNQKPNVNSEADFPTLGGALECEASSRDGSFMKVKDGAKCDQMSEVTTKVTLENKFKALSN